MSQQNSADPSAPTHEDQGGSLNFETLNVHDALSKLRHSSVQYIVAVMQGDEFVVDTSLDIHPAGLRYVSLMLEGVFDDAGQVQGAVGTDASAGGPRTVAEMKEMWGKKSLGALKKEATEMAIKALMECKHPRHKCAETGREKQAVYWKHGHVRLFRGQARPGCINVIFPRQLRAALDTRSGGGLPKGMLVDILVALYQHAEDQRRRQPQRQPPHQLVRDSGGDDDETSQRSGTSRVSVASRWDPLTHPMAWLIKDARTRVDVALVRIEEEASSSSSGSRWKVRVLATKTGLVDSNLVRDLHNVITVDGALLRRAKVSDINSMPSATWRWCNCGSDKTTFVQCGECHVWVHVKCLVSMTGHALRLPGRWKTFVNAASRRGVAFRCLFCTPCSGTDEERSARHAFNVSVLLGEDSGIRERRVRVANRFRPYLPKIVEEQEAERARAQVRQATRRRAEGAATPRRSERDRRPTARAASLASASSASERAQSDDDVPIHLQRARARAQRAQVRAQRD